MRYYADVTYGGTVQNPDLLLRNSVGKITEAYNRNISRWEISDFYDNKYITGDTIFWEDITEEQANDIIRNWSNELHA